MEGFLLKNDGFLSGWVQYYFILHECNLLYQDSKRTKTINQINLSEAKVGNIQRDPLLIKINCNSVELQLKAASIKEKVEWINAMILAQQSIAEKKTDQSKKLKEEETQGSPLKTRTSMAQPSSNFQKNQQQTSTTNDGKAQEGKDDWHEQLNLAFVTKVFKPESPFFLNLGRIWEAEAQLEELNSLIVPEAQRTKNPLLVDYADKIQIVSQSMKNLITQCVDEMEDTRKEMFRVAKLMLKLKENLSGKGNYSKEQLKQAYLGALNQNYPTHSGEQAASLYNTKNSYVSGQQSQQSPPRQQNLQIENLSPIYYEQQRQDQSAHSNNNFKYQSPQQDIFAKNNRKTGGGLNNDLFEDNYDDNVGNGGGSNLIQYENNGKNTQIIRKESDRRVNSRSQNVNQVMQTNALKPGGAISNGNEVIMGYGGIPITYWASFEKRSRDFLPAFIPEKQSYSIWAILKEAIGKDLTRITMPIFLNEPISILQKISELMQYYDLLKRAVNEKNEFRRLALLTTFIMVQYSSVDNRNRKPFNPILGETFEIIQPEWRWISEQVSHHPPISAFHCEGKGWYTYGNTDIKNHFWGSSLEFKCIGLQHFFFTETNEHFVIKRPDNSANNIIIGKLYVDVHGNLEVNNVSRGTKGHFYIHRQGWTQKNSHRVDGKVTDSKGTVIYEVNGVWNKEFKLKNVATGEEEVIWRMQPLNPQFERQYGFDYYTIQLNYLNDEMKRTLPPTDCRRRPDQRLMEEGDYAGAAKEKHRLEEKQRTARKLREEMQIPSKPLWFIEQDEEYSAGAKAYIFTGAYWEKRKNLDYSEFPDLY